MRVLQEQDARAVPANVPGPPSARVPLYDRKGNVKSYALVDRADLPSLLGFRWYETANGYAARQETVAAKKQRTVLMAREILGLVPGDGKETEHVSRDKLDNRRLNLLVVTHAQNAQNRKRTRNDSIPRGVAFRKDRRTRPWAAYASKDGKQHHLGFFDTPEEAGEVALSWRRENMPFATD